MAKSDIITLMRTAVAGPPVPHGTVPESTHFERALRAGLGPLMASAWGPTRPSALPQTEWDRLQGTVLAARMLTDVSLSALTDIVDACHHEGIAAPILLKGISACLQHYPAPHLRPMRDMDLLVERGSVDAFERLLHRLGYRQESDLPATFYDSIHHTMPHYQPDTGIWVEVHTDLFPPRSAFAEIEAFRAERLLREAVDVPLLGRRMRCLRMETQLAYTSAHWMEEFRPIGGALPLMDIAFMLAGNHGQPDWDVVLARFEDTPAAGALYIALSVLRRNGLAPVPGPVTERLRRAPTTPNRVSTAVLHYLARRRLFDQRPVGGRLAGHNSAVVWRTLTFSPGPLNGLHLLPWRLLFPPARGDRFSPLFQLRRVGSALKRLRESDLP